MNLNMAVHILGFDGHQERAEPLERTKIPAHPEEVDFAKTRLLLRVVHPVPDALQDGSEGGNADTGTNENSNLVLEDIFGCTAKRSIHVHSREDLSDSGIDACASRSVIHPNNRRAFRSFLLSSAVEIAAQRLA